MRTFDFSIPDLIGIQSKSTNRMHYYKTSSLVMVSDVGTVGYIMVEEKKKYCYRFEVQLEHNRYDVDMDDDYNSEDTYNDDYLKLRNAQDILFKKLLKN